jgi:hypothetical protein
MIISPGYRDYDQGLINRPAMARRLNDYSPTRTLSKAIVTVKLDGFTGGGERLYTLV